MWVYILVLVMQDVHCILTAPWYVTCSLSGPTIFFFTLSHKCMILVKKINEHKMCLWFPLQLSSEIFIILRRIQRDIITNVDRFHVKYPLFLQYFKQNSFPQHISKKFSTIKFHENPSTGRRAVRCRQTHNMAKLIVAFCNLCEHT